MSLHQAEHGVEGAVQVGGIGVRPQDERLRERWLHCLVIPHKELGKNKQKAMILGNIVPILTKDLSLFDQFFGFHFFLVSMLGHLTLNHITLI